MVSSLQGTNAPAGDHEGCARIGSDRRLVDFRFGGSPVGRDGVNCQLVGGLMALAMLTVAERPADEDHPFGHGKAEYFSGGVEGTLILIAAPSIGVVAVDRLISPKPLEKIGKDPVSRSKFSGFGNKARAQLVP